jgi:hypothetical protein
MVPSNAYGSVVEGEFKQVAARRGGRIVTVEHYAEDRSKLDEVLGLRRCSGRKRTDRQAHMVTVRPNGFIEPRRPSHRPGPTGCEIKHGRLFSHGAREFAGEAREQHSHDASEENTIESPGAADRGDWRPEPSDGVEV